MKRLYLDYEKCIECRLCELACAAEKEGVYNPLKARIQSERVGLPEQIVMIYCHHCSKPACYDCPSDAMSINDQGVVVIDEDECTGCGICVDNCPAQAIFWRPHGEDIAMKCDLCGGSPKCVEVCPRDAIVYGEYEAEALLPPEKVLEKNLSKKGLKVAEFHVSQED